MRIHYTEKFLKQFHDAPPYVQQALRKQALFLVADLHHPSLHAKKYHEQYGIWQARVTLHWRFYFSIIGDSYIFHKITIHPK